MNRSKRTALPFGVLVLALPVAHLFAQALQPIGTLTITDVTPQPVNVFRAGVSYSVPPTTGGASGAATFSTFTLTKLVDSISPTLLVNAASGRVFPEARIDLFGPDGQTVLTTYELFNTLVLGAVVTSMQTGDSRALVEEVSLDYQRIRQTVFTPDGPVVGCWDRAQNQAC